MGSGKTLPATPQHQTLLQEGDQQWRPLSEIVCDLREMNHPAASEAASLLLDMLAQIKRQHAAINLERMYREALQEEFEEWRSKLKE